MSFFGTFLIEERLITEKDFRRADALMEGRNLPLEALAREQGLLDDSAIEIIKHEEELRNLDFEAAAIRLGALSAEQCESLKLAQRGRQIRLGEALVEIGALDEKEVEPLARIFEKRRGNVATVPADLPRPLSGNQLAEYIVTSLPGRFLRICRLVTQLGPARGWSHSGGLPLHRCSMEITGDTCLRVTLAVDAPFQEKVKTKLAGGLEELMVHFIHSITSPISLLGHRMGSVSIDPNTTPAFGVALDIETPSGIGLLILNSLDG